MAARWKALVLWKARGTIVVREGIAEGVASETSRFLIRDEAVMSGVLVGSMSEAEWVKVFLLVDDTYGIPACGASLRRPGAEQDLERFSGQLLNDMYLVLEGKFSQPHEEGPSAPRA
jgi:hypothetical protein